MATDPSNDNVEPLNVLPYRVWLFTISELNAISPLLTCNLTVLLNPLAVTVIVLTPNVNAVAFPKKSLPFAVFCKLCN